MKKILLVAVLMTASTSAFSANNNTEMSGVEIVNVINDDVDDLLNAYEKYVNQYIATLAKAKNGDASAMAEYAKLLQKATDLQKKLEKVKGDMTPAQMNRLLKIMQKLNKAAANL